MSRLKTSKDEIIYLLNKAIDKYKSDTGEQIVLNTNRKNYEGLAVLLSGISNQLPERWEEWGTEKYPEPKYDKDQYVYPYRKYDITGGQIKDALSGIVSNPRPFLVDACYVYLYGMGRKAFEKTPVDSNLLETEATTGNTVPDKSIAAELEKEIGLLRSTSKKRQKIFVVAMCILAAALVTMIVLFINKDKTFSGIKKDLSILPYQPTQQEIDSLEGVWLCYTGSPQARSSDPNRYHLVVSNVVDVKYNKNGYFTFTRYGASFDHIGHMQFESPWLVSIHSYVRNSEDQIESPRHSLMRLDKEKQFIPVISASWNFDVGNRNNIIGIRELYIKQGKDGVITEVLNTRENVGCHCKIVQWNHGDYRKNFYLKNELLDTLPEPSIRALLNESSIILRVPQEGLVIKKDSAY